MVSRGNPSTISDAKDKIFKALLGIVIIFSSYLILNTINPDFVNLKIRDPMIPPQFPTISDLLGPGSNTATPGFTINGGPSAYISPGQSVTLVWTGTGGWDHCEARSAPLVSEWDSNKGLTGTQPITLSDEGQYTFYLTCGEGGSSQVIAFVYSAPPPTDPPIITFFRINGSDNSSFNWPADFGGSSNITISWEAQNATAGCAPSGTWAQDIGTSGSVPFLIDTAIRINTFTLTCTNPAGFVSRTKTIQITQ